MWGRGPGSSHVDHRCVFLTLFSVTTTVASLRHRLLHGSEFSPPSAASVERVVAKADGSPDVLVGRSGRCRVLYLVCMSYLPLYGGYCGSVFLVRCFLHLRTHFPGLFVSWSGSSCSCSCCCSCSSCSSCGSRSSRSSRGVCGCSSIVGVVV